MSTIENPKQRIAFTDIERQRLRLYQRNYPSLTPHQLASWFESEYGRKVSNSSVYDILSDKYAYLDNAEATNAVRKKKGPQWAELEGALFKWWQDVQPRDVTGRELKTKANELWQMLPACRGKKVPSFSDGWLSNWRTRHDLSQCKRSMEVEMGSSEAGKTEEIQYAPLDSVPYSRQCVSSPRILGLTISNFDPPFTLPIEYGHMSLPYSAHQITVNSQFLSCSPSMTKHYLPITSSSQCRTSFRKCQTRVDGRNKAKRVKLTTSRPSDAANFQDMIPCSKSTKAVTPVNITLWKGVQELHWKCNALKGRDLIMTGGVVAKFLEPILSSIECSNRWLILRGVAAVNVKKVIGLFLASETFRVQLGINEPQHLILEEWFLDFISHEAFRSQSPEYAAIEGRSHCLTTIASALAKDGRVDVSTRTYASLDKANDNKATQHLQAKIVITPPATLRSVPQTIVHLATITSAFSTTLLTPIISFRTIIPLHSKIFEIAKYGTSTDLQMMLSKGEASLTNCDPYGRSLINYALQGRNYSTLKFLITMVEDIDALEVNDSKRQIPLVRLLDSTDAYDDICRRDMRLKCLKLMLLADANTNLRSWEGLSTFQDELLYGTVATTKALLDLGQPHVNVNAISHSTFKSPLLYLATCYGRLSKVALDMHEKVFLILERGACVAARDRYGRSCLHLVLGFNANMKRGFAAYQEEEFKDILMCMVTAGADVFASDDCGRTASQTAVMYGHEELWREVLTECGYDPDAVFCLKHEFDCIKDNLSIGVNYCCCQEIRGARAFSTATPVVRSIKLSFTEYSRQRKLLDCVQKVYSREERDIKKIWRDCDEFWGSIAESSDSEDYEWVSVEEDDDDEGDEKDHDEDEYDCELDECSSGGEDYHDENYEYGGDNMGEEEYPELLYDGVHWLIAFS